ncbi:hypothetical protein MCOR27_008552 [Pyricularia oryzae]|uniref:DUF7053 domain-containing protein n=1 Tax=Pyricularia grisea TaxID=148305 RepID=A0ABQ8NAG9_PYRGI|nr:hypothetical protein MCOR01_004855 [Pyricularia oryzae]KAI6293969.1 hypothetical protein MCOR33_008771 [Pyricularia grisea]KAH9431598.1 hypothetical protein MCOR02_008888 [Pyricularia oryzae]KAI6255295.1 hypothetical protein MCOR19_008213 [Pyricularia oryzae]KAI6269567.1 hypothetical protein MCOR26_008643 [Pyricularia oryzae]
MVLRKKEVYTTITPIPGFIPRQLAIDILHSHSEVITLNPLVLDHKAIPAPRDAASDEFYSTWYEITERIQYIPGIGKMGSGKINFNGCFHDMPWGLQTHIYAPMNVDLRNKYRIAGNQPGIEPPEPPEIGMAALGVPSDGLYLREDIEIKCNMAVVGFVKAELKKASKEMVQRIIKKAELLDAGVLQGMIEDGKLKTINPADRSNTVRSANTHRTIGTSPSIMAGVGSPQPSPTMSQHSTHASPAIPYTIPRPQSTMYGRPGTAGSTGGYASPPQTHHHELCSSQQASAPQHEVIMELPGDFYHPPQKSPRLPPPGQQQQQQQGSPRGSLSSSSPPPSAGLSSDRHVSSVSSQGRWSEQQNSVSRPHSFMSDIGPDQKASFASDLSTHDETAEEHHRDNTLKALDGSLKTPPLPSQQQQQQPQAPKGYTYNPADYAKVSPPVQSTPKFPGNGGYNAYNQQQQRYGY